MKIKRKHDGRELVWKELQYGSMNDKEKQQIVAEVNILRELRHPCIVRYYDRIIDKVRFAVRVGGADCLLEPGRAMEPPPARIASSARENDRKTGKATNANDY